MTKAKSHPFGVLRIVDESLKVLGTAPKQKDLAKYLEVSPTTVHRHVSKLKETQAIETTPRYKASATKIQTYPATWNKFIKTEKD